MALHERLGFTNNLKRICDFHNKVIFPIKSPLKKNNALSLVMLKVKLIHKGTNCIFKERKHNYSNLCNSEQY